MKNGVDSYKTATLVRQVFFPKGKEVCRYCPYCLSDARNHKRECCVVTGEILPFADLVIDTKCPLIWEDKNDER